MNDFNKPSLMENLAKSYSSISDLLEGIDLNIGIYKESDWSIKDIIGHISTWDHQVTKSLNAYNAGKDYSIPEFEEDTFNQQEVLEGRKLTDQQVISAGEQARKDLIAAIQNIPLDMFPGDVLYPWGDERGSIDMLVQFMIDHDTEHKSEIEKAFQSSNTR